jgi:class 3 adenylate cyclase
MARDTIQTLKQRLKRATRARRELERRMFQLKTLYDLSREIGFVIDTQPILQNLVMMVVGTFGAECGLIVLIDTERRRIEAMHHLGVDPDRLQELSQAATSGALDDLRSVDGIRPLTSRGGRPAGQSLRLLSGLGLRIWASLSVTDRLIGGIGLGPKLTGDRYSRDDHELLATLANQGAVALRNAWAHQEVVRHAAELEASLRRIQVLESIKSNLAKFVPMTVQELIEESPEAPSFDKRELDVSVLFADISAYTRVSAELPLDKVNKLVERYFSAFLDEILSRGGDVNETAGDGLMVIFRKRDPRRHARAAVLAALGIQRRTREINDQLQDELRPITMKVGVNSGIAAVGATKIEGMAGLRWTYTASGPTTNIAARLAALAEGGAVIITEETRTRLGEEFDVEGLGLQKLKNVDVPIPAYRVKAPEA